MIQKDIIRVHSCLVSVNVAFFGLLGALNLAQGKIHFQKRSAGSKRAKQGSASVSPSIPWIWTSKHFQPFSVYILSKGNRIFRCARFSWSHFSHWVIHRFNFAHKESLLAPTGALIVIACYYWSARRQLFQILSISANIHSSMMFYDVLWCSMMFYDVLWCSMS